MRGKNSNQNSPSTQNGRWTPNTRVEDDEAIHYKPQTQKVPAESPGNNLLKKLDTMKRDARYTATENRDGENQGSPYKMVNFMTKDQVDQMKNPY